MEEIDQMLNQWIHNSIIRAKLREAIIHTLNDKKIEAFKAGYEAAHDEVRAD